MPLTGIFPAPSPNGPQRPSSTSFHRGYRHPSVSHGGEEFGYVLKGDLTLVVGDKGYSLGPGDNFHFPARYPHSYSTERGAKVLIVSTHKSFEAQANLRMEN